MDYSAPRRAVFDFLTYLLTIGGIYAIMALGLNIQAGYGGLLNFGHIAFAGIGAYATGIAHARGGAGSGGGGAGGGRGAGRGGGGGGNGLSGGVRIPGDGGPQRGLADRRRQGPQRHPGAVGEPAAPVER